MKFSRFEIKEIVKAWLAVSVIFAIAMVGINMKVFAVLPIMLITAGIGFLLHEMAHKYVAQKYHCWAEFRSDGKALLLGLLISLTGFIILAPGAVFIRGANHKQHGKIALAGPMMNLLLALIFYALMGIVATPLLTETMKYGFKINGLLAAFNMIPFPMFDGYAVWRWNRVVYVICLVAAVIVAFI